MKGQQQLFASARSQTSRDAGSTDDWGTPQAFYDLLDKEFGFTLDPCASAENAKCAYFDINDNGLEQDWGENICFVNFPYSQARAWAAKCVDAAEKGATVVVLCASRTDTAWWQNLTIAAEEVRFVAGRLAFTRPGMEPMGAPFPSSVIVLRPGLEQHEHEGTPMTWLTLWSLPADVRR